VRSSRAARAARAVDEDPQQPGLERGAPREAVEAAQDAQPCVLDDLFGDRPAGNEGGGQAQQHRLVAIHERKERRLIAGPQAHQQLGVLVGGVRPLAAQVHRGGPDRVDAERPEGGEQV
jgi:hypothetical protein